MESDAATLKRVLLVEDEPDISFIATRALEAFGGYTVQPCNDSRDAINQANGFKPDIILLDVMMPGKDGPTTLSELNEISSLNKIPVVFMTARVQKEELEEYSKMGAVGVIPKPFDPLSLAAELQKIWSNLSP